MTAASAFVGRSAAYLLTDSAMFLDDGTIKEIRSKVIASDRLRLAAVMSGRECVEMRDEGSYSPAHDAAQLLEQSGSQGEFLRELPRLMRSLYGIMRQVGSGCFQFTIALWNPADDRPEAWVIGTPGHTFEGLPPFELAGVSETVMPPVDRALWPQSGALTRSEALAIINAQRRSREANGSCHVGGFAELTTVDASGVRKETLCRWPDRVDRKIEPNRRRLLGLF